MDSSRHERLLALDEKLSAILQGDARPADAGERLRLAELCQQYKQRYVAAARFYADAFAAALAKQRKAEFITGDPDFKRLEKEIKIMWLK